MSTPLWKFVFETDLNQVLREKRIKGLVLNDLLNNGRRLYLRKQEAADQQKQKNPEAVLAELENI